MTEAESQLAAFWAETEAPSRDLVFEFGVEHAIARRRLLIGAAGVAAGLAAVGGFALALGPGMLSGLGVPVATFDAVGPVLAAVAAIGVAMVWFGRVPDEA